jgi:hypothetical protein
MGLCLWSASFACSQSAVSSTPTSALRAHLKEDRFQPVTAIRGLPLGVRDGLQRLFGSTLDIANPGEPFQSGADAGNSQLPTRRLISAACAMDHCIVYYERGGATPAWRVALYKWTPADTQFELGGVAPRDLKSIDEVWKAVLSGGITGPAKEW